ncbi:MAG TPA: hypothetical protein P5123_10955 [Spirochaetota bacterium]|nr:hypothetical protein [Spirochaetota bacterium]
MANAIISVKDDKSEYIIKEAKKKCIDEDINFTNATLALLEMWVKGEISIKKGETV